MSAVTRPGIHSGFDITKFSIDEQRSIRALATNFFVTNDGSDIVLSRNSRYRFVLLKCSDDLAEGFGLHREIIALFSLYDSFEPRTLDAYDHAYQKYPDLRIEKVCRIIVSADINIEAKIKNTVALDPESPIYIPFYIKELTSSVGSDQGFLFDRMRRHFFTRDLFAFNSPLKKDLYFFGRTGLIQELIDRSQNGEHSGIFGLRKSGKTSVVYGIERALTLTDNKFLLVDCQDPSIHGRRWYELLHWLSREAFIRCGKQGNIRPEDVYSERDAAMYFAEDMRAAGRSLKGGRILLCLDEIERISFSTASSPHWRNDRDALLFWQSIRSAAQRFPESFSLLIAGTNPRCVELPRICEDDNPIFQFVKVYYLSGFKLEDTLLMLKQLGQYIGLNFTDEVCAKLNDDYGGQPFLIRHACSKVHLSTNRTRPILIQKPVYESVRREFDQEIDPFLEMIVGVLRESYPDEFELLGMLADGNEQEFRYYANSDTSLTRHLLGYGVLLRDSDHFSFKLEVIREYMRRLRKHRRLVLSNEERWSEISERRNSLEQQLRVLIRQQLTALHGKKAHSILLAAINERRRGQYQSIGFRELLHKTESKLYFSDLSDVIVANWQSFEHILNLSKQRVTIALEDINKYRSDAHAKDISDDEFGVVRMHFDQLEKALQEFDDG